MNNSLGTIPNWRIVLWGVVTAVAVDTLIYFLSQRAGAQVPSGGQYLMGPFLGLCISIAIFMARSMQAQRDQILNSQDSADSDSKDWFSKTTMGKILSCLIGSFFLIIAGVGVYSGHITSGGKHHHYEVYRAHDPGMFWFNVLFYAGIGGYLIYRPFRSNAD